MLFSLRLGDLCHMNQDYIDQLLAILAESGKPFDEVWLASSYDLLSIADCEKNAVQMGLAGQKFEKAGVMPSMQVSRTIGHGHIKTEAGVKGLPTNRITNIDGVAGANFCWNNDAFRSYVDQMLRAYVQFQPKIVWVDDDLRIRNQDKARALCFCDHCIALFNEKYHHQYTRETLKEDFLYNSPTIRKEYVAFQTETLSDFARLIATAIHAVSPDTRLALQNGGNTGIAIDAQKACLDEMKAVTEKDPAFRAGGGFYADHNPAQMLNKAIQLNYINSRLPDYVKMRSCEIENLPFVAYGKSHEATCIEAALYMAYGCNMASVTLMNHDEPLSYHRELFEKIVKYRPYLQHLADQALDTVNGGLCIYQPEKSHLNFMKNDASRHWNDTAIWEATGLLRCGIPMHAGRKGKAYLLTEKACDYLAPEDVDFLLRKSVITDGASIEKLLQMGYGDSLDVRAQKASPAHQRACYEMMRDHPINQGLQLDHWQDSPYFKWEYKYVLTGENIQPVADYYSYATDEYLGCAAAVIQTAYGAKWFVRGAYLCNGVISLARRNQLIQAINYISPRPLPAYISSAEQTAIIPRLDAEGFIRSLTLLNISITENRNLRVFLPEYQGKTTGILLDPYQPDQSIQLTKEAGGVSFILDSLAPWRMKTILLEA